MVPGVSQGITAISVRAGGTTATATINVMPSNSYGPATPVTDALKPLGPNLKVCFYLDNNSKTWLFYDPLFPEYNTLSTLSTGQVYFVLVNRTTSVVLNGKTRYLSCLDGDCWSLIVW